jgi:hypothetical protein
MFSLIDENEVTVGRIGFPFAKSSKSERVDREYELFFGATFVFASGETIEMSAEMVNDLEKIATIFLNKDKNMKRVSGKNNMWSVIIVISKLTSLRLCFRTAVCIFNHCVSVV